MRSFVGTLAALCLILAALASAQTYPERQVTVVIPFPPGGAVDPIARTVTQHMSEQWRQPIVLINRAGAGGNIGAEQVVRAAPDGYTLLVGSTALAISPSLYKNLSYDAVKDLAPITQLVVTPNLLVVHPAVPAHSVRELIALAKARPGKLRSASAGAGSSNHLALLLFNSLAGVDIAHIPYKGAAPAVTDVLGGHVEMTFVPIPAALPLVQAGKLRALAVSTARRSIALPEAPTIAEAGVSGYEAGSWTALFAPAATPRAILNKIHATAAESLQAPGVQDILVKAGAEPVGNAPDDFAQIVRGEVAKWGKVIQAAGGKLE